MSLLMGLFTTLALGLVMSECGDYTKVPTSPEVWAVIRARHKELVVFGSYSAPDGDEFGDPNEGRMMTEYGFQCSRCPLIGVETRWDINRDHPHTRENERHEYWLCAPREKPDE